MTAKQKLDIVEKMRSVVRELEGAKTLAQEAQSSLGYIRITSVQKDAIACLNSLNELETVD